MIIVIGYVIDVMIHHGIMHMYMIVIMVIHIHVIVIGIVMFIVNVHGNVHHVMVVVILIKIVNLVTRLIIYGLAPITVRRLIVHLMRYQLVGMGSTQ